MGGECGRDDGEGRTETSQADAEEDRIELEAGDPELSGENVGARHLW